MPIYEYGCEQCGHEFEALQKMSDEPLKKCPNCNAESLKKKVSAAAFRLKGGGWYETDFKSGNKKNLAATDAAPDKAKGDKKDGSAKSSESASSDTKATTKKADSAN